MQFNFQVQSYSKMIQRSSSIYTFNDQVPYLIGFDRGSIAFQIWRFARMENFIWRGPCQDAGYKYRFAAGLRLYRQYVTVACSRLTRYFKACYAPLSLSHRRTSLKEGRKAARERELRCTDAGYTRDTKRETSLALSYVWDHREPVL